MRRVCVRMRFFRRLLGFALLGGVVVMFVAVLGAAAAGSTNTKVTIDTPTEGSTVLLDSSGFPVVGYVGAASRRGTANGAVKVAHCVNVSCKGTQNSITAPATGGSFDPIPSMALDARGFPVLAYTLTSTNPFQMQILHCGNATCSSGNVVTTPVTFGEAPSLALDSSGFPVVAYVGSTDHYLYVLHCGDTTCGSGNTINPVDTSGNLGVSPLSLKLDSSGSPVIAYYDNTNGDLDVLHCGDATCSSGNTTTSPDTAGNVGANPSLALDQAGFPVVSYYDATNLNLKVLHCGDATCSSGNTITVPDPNKVTTGAYYSSLALDAHGFPVVAYETKNLQLLHCGNATCSSGNTITSPDNGGYPAPFVISLALDASGFPVVTYGISDGLKLLHCGSATC